MCLMIVTTIQYLYCGHSETHSNEKLDCNDTGCKHSEAHKTKDHWGLDCWCIEYLGTDHRHTPPIEELCPHCTLAPENPKGVNMSAASQNEDTPLIKQNSREASITMVVPKNTEERNTGTTSNSTKNMKPCGMCQDERKKCTPVQGEPTLCQICKKKGISKCPPHQPRRTGASRGNSMASDRGIEYKFVNTGPP